MSVFRIVERFPVPSTTATNNPTKSSVSYSGTSSNTAYPGPTSTGEPTCGQGSGFDGTVNDDYLILCNTELPGYNIELPITVEDFAECIEECTQYTNANSGAPCVAVEYQSVSLDRGHSSVLLAHAMAEPPPESMQHQVGSSYCKQRKEQPLSSCDYRECAIRASHRV